MAFEAFSSGKNQAHRHKAMALSVISATGTIVLLTLGIAFLARSASARSEKPPEDDVLDIKLQSKIEEELKPEPTPEPTPEPAAPAKFVPKNIKINKLAPPPKPLVAPTEDSKAKLKEADPSQDKGVSGSHDGSSDGSGSGHGRGTGKPVAKKAVVVPKVAKPPPPEKKRVSISENTTPPVPISRPLPMHPADLKEQGVETVLVVRILISETGSVIAGKRLRGDRRFWPAVKAVLMRWRYKPAMGPDGQPVKYPQVISIPFKIRT
jgi:hypothetical protein